MGSPHRSRQDRGLRRFPPRPKAEDPARLMPSIVSKLDVSGASFQRNRARMLELVAELRSLEARASDASAKAKPLFDKRGQLLPRERIARLLDPGAPWLELSSIAGFCRDNPDPAKSIPGGGMLSGIGYVN